MANVKLDMIDPRNLGIKSNKGNKNAKVNKEDLEACKKYLIENPELMARAGIWSPYIRMEKVYTFGDSGSIVVLEKEKKIPLPDGTVQVISKQVADSPAVVGYLLLNEHPTDSLKIMLTKYSRDRKEDSRYIEETVEQLVGPNETVRINKCDLAILGATIEFCGMLANGNIHATSNDVSTAYFKPTNGQVKVTSDEITINIGEIIGTGPKGGNIFGVKDEYFDTFGYLENEDLSKKKKSVDKLDRAAMTLYMAGLINKGKYSNSNANL